MSTIKILGVRLDNLTGQALQQRLAVYLASQQNHLIVTVNPEFTLAAQKNQTFSNILNQADLSLPDGFGLSLAALTYGQKLIRHTGADLTADLLIQAEKNGWPIAIINWRGGLSPAAILRPALLTKFPKLRCLIEDCGRNGYLGQRQLSRLNDFQPRLVFCSLGAPYQEYFLAKHQTTWPSCRIMIGIGGSFDFIIGRIKRAPQLWRRCGLEWLWRLIQQPWRWRRIWNAVAVFSWRFIIWRYKNKNR
ncbi:MAG TPA: WecB/TagA/CpsF family glycosyltransferase [bacterium]|jgi:N-acetylglucosaminyldiphosphoundecaprenol N-acetyl-beta-D-mannosaminyltransferase|nr:WecB/TagA/CpsF family glycosyltransferase [bacterium]HNZ51157.1 WecB/TagA/CpsF family glycosyltransferase [bacterium]HOF79619.1 WecB/TagA/CpsF family glycosyltransferase [bacterium]HOH85500.1 WecB/TagA/CpsF family glycosyltransferase [bacterium]HOQ91860.1 WecB/TagA/CpsF family glycosyltransferase [bacterium]